MYPPEIGGNMPDNDRKKGQHLTWQDRHEIQKGLREHRSFREIAEFIGCSPDTVSKEIRNHRYHKVRTYVKAWNSIPPSKPSELRTFLGKITRNLAFDVYKKRKPRSAVADKLTFFLTNWLNAFPEETNRIKNMTKKNFKMTSTTFWDVLIKKKAPFLSEDTGILNP